MREGGDMLNIRNLWMYMLAGLIFFENVSIGYLWYGGPPPWVDITRAVFTVAFIAAMAVRLYILWSDRNKEKAATG